ncbi:MAG TPA: hypothetical protein VEL82_06680 [Thermoplasmata archaeon]|nr:hypothetical protein [Thermoplasmata archaeon]
MRLAGSLWVLLGAPAFVYAAAATVAGLPPGVLASLVAAYAAAAAIVVLPYFWPAHGGLFATAIFVALLLVVVGTIFGSSPLGSGGDTVTFGALAAGPLILFIVTCRDEEGLGTRVLGLAVAAADALALLAARAISLGLPGGLSTASLLAGYLEVIGSQARGVANLIAGAPGATLPLEAVSDPAFVALVGLATLATLLTFVRPATGSGAELPTVEAGRAGEEDPAATYELSAEFRAALAARSRAEPPPLGRLPGLPALLAAVVVAGLVALGISLAPTTGLCGTSVGAIAAVAAVILVVRRPFERGAPGAPDPVAPAHRAGRA